MSLDRRIVWGLGLALAALLAPRSHGAGWIQTKIPGFKVCSDLSEAETRSRLAGLLLVIDDFDLVWPTPQKDQVAPGLIVFCSRPAESVPDQRAAQRNLFLTRDPTDVFFNTGFLPSDGFPRFHFKYGPLMDVWGNHALQRTYSAYFQSLMGERERVWLNQGLAKLLQGMICERGAIVLPGLIPTGTLLNQNQRGSSSSGARPVPMAASAIISLPELFETDKAPPITALRIPSAHNGRYLVGPDNRGFWPMLPFSPFLDEAYQVVRFGLFGDGGKHRQAFIKFALAASNGPTDEADFHAQLGMDEGTFLHSALHDPTVGKEYRFLLPPRVGPSAAIAAFTPIPAAEVKRVLQLYTRAKRPHLSIGSTSSSSNGVTYFESLEYNINDLY